MVFGFTDPGGANPTPNRPTTRYQSVRPSVPSFQDPGLSAGQFGFGSSVNKKPSAAPKMSTYDAGKKAYADFLRSQTGQSGGVSSIPTQSRVQSYMKQDPYGAATVRAKYFDNRPIPTERLQRRGMQDKLVDQFKAQYTYQQPGTNLYQMKPGAPMSLADYTMELGRELGPTPSEILGDAQYAFSSMGKGLAEKGTPMMNLAKSFIGGIQDFFMPNQAPGTTDQFASYKQGLTNPQLAIFNYHINSGNSPEFARQMAVMNRPIAYANGGIATLN